MRFRPYTAVTPQRSLLEVNTETAAGLEGALPYEERDLVPQALFDAALWHSVYGATATPPGPGPGASLEERERAFELQRAWRQGQSPTQWLNQHARPGD